MRSMLFITLAVAAGCTGSLTEEQRRAVKEDMESHAIRKVTDAQLTEAAFQKGRQMVQELEKAKDNTRQRDSIIQASGGSVRWIVPGTSASTLVEQQLIDAYIASETGGAQDNVQKIRGSDGTDTDSILYSKPVLEKQEDGSDVLTGVWNIWLSRKELIRAMD